MGHCAGWTCSLTQYNFPHSVQSLSSSSFARIPVSFVSLSTLQGKHGSCTNDQILFLIRSGCPVPLLNLWPCSGFSVSGRCPHPRLGGGCEGWSRWGMGDATEVRVKGLFPWSQLECRDLQSPEGRRDFQAFPIHQPLATQFSFCLGVGFLEDPAERCRERRLSHIMHVP